MIYESQNRKLEVVKVTKSNETNTVMVCRDIASPSRDYYSVIALKSHKKVRQLLSVLEQSEARMREQVIDTFSWNGEFVVVLPYRQERPLSEFYMGEAYTLAHCEKICINLVVECIRFQLPWQILYLVLRQGQVNLSKDDEIYFGYQIDFSDFDPARGEDKCAEYAAVLLKRMLEPKASQKAVSYKLLEKRIENDSYRNFTDLYRDISMAAISEKKKGFFARMKNIYHRNRDTIFKVLLRLAMIFVIIAAAAFLTQLIFGDVVWLAFLFNHFKTIGTENLYK